MVTPWSGAAVETRAWVMGCTALSEVVGSLWPRGEGPEPEETDSKVSSSVWVLLTIEAQVGHGPA